MESRKEETARILKEAEQIKEIGEYLKEDLKRIEKEGKNGEFGRTAETSS